MEKPVIAVDVDEVLTYFVEPLIQFHNRVYGTNLEIDKFHNYHFAKVWGGTDEEATQKVELFYESPEFASQVPIQGAYEVLKRLKEKYKLVIVTSRRLSLAERTHAFIQKYYPNIFDDIKLGNHYSREGPVMSKEELCKLLNAKILIDDNYHYCKGCANENIKAILFGDYAWNQVDEELPENIVRVKDWSKVEEAIKKLLN